MSFFLFSFAIIEKMFHSLENVSSTLQNRKQAGVFHKIQPMITAHCQRLDFFFSIVKSLLFV
jgi:hypothetical protein